MKFRCRVIFSAAAYLALSCIAHAEELDGAATTRILDEIAASRKSTGASEVRFTERRASPLTRDPVTSTGILALHPDGRFRRETEGRSTMINDGEHLWIYYPAFGEAEKYAIATPGPAADAIAILSEGLRLHDVERRFRVTVERTSVGVRLELIPKAGRLRKLIRTMQIDLDDSLRLTRLECLGGQGEQTVLEFSDERKLPGDSDRFRFSPPEGIKIVQPLGN
jgi:outer membrane lipoprotein-sorting protein